MNIALLAPALAVAVSVGVGCGTCCSPVISTFLSTYVFSHAGGIKKGVLSFVSFFFGKMLSVSLLCIAAAFISRQFISEDGYIGSFNLRQVSQMVMSAIGVVMVIRWFLELKRQKNCGNCKKCGKPEAKSGIIPMLVAGITYGMTPCAPLLMMGYCLSLPVPLAGVTGIAFSLSSMLSPILLLVIITGALSGKMCREIPGAVKWFRLASYLMLMVVPFLFTLA